MRRLSSHSAIVFARLPSATLTISTDYNQRNFHSLRHHRSPNLDNKQTNTSSSICWSHFTNRSFARLGAAFSFGTSPFSFSPTFFFELLVFRLDTWFSLIGRCTSQIRFGQLFSFGRPINLLLNCNRTTLDFLFLFSLSSAYVQMMCGCVRVQRLMCSHHLVEMHLHSSYRRIVLHTYHRRFRDAFIDRQSSAHLSAITVQFRPETECKAQCEFFSLENIHKPPRTVIRDGFTCFRGVSKLASSRLVCVCVCLHWLRNW